MSLAVAQAVVPLLTPHGHLRLVPDSDALPLPAPLARRLGDAFARGPGHGLLQLGGTEVGSILPPSWAWWRDFAARYVTALCATPEGGAVAAPDDRALDALIADAPPMTGAEYMSTDVLIALWGELDAALREELVAAKVTLQAFLKSLHPVWNLVGRVHFNLAENRKDAEAPFAFLATYTSRLSSHGKVQHLPLSQALTEFSDGKSQARLLSLLMPVQRAAEQCAWLRAMVESGEIYHPLRWLPADAYRFLSDVPKLEAAGIIVRAPGAWQAGRPARPRVKASIGAQMPSLLGKDALLDFSIEVTLDGERLDTAEIRALLAGSDGLHLLRGRWVEVDRKKLGSMLERFKAIEQAAAERGLPFAEAMRLLAGASLDQPDNSADADWSQLVAGPWLAETLRGLRQPEGLAQVSPGAELKATLRPYQQVGVRWLYLLTRLGLGACLADDMGLGKTIQVLSLLLILKREDNGDDKEFRPSLLVVPASLLANWAAESARFSPDLRILIAHPSECPANELRALDTQRLSDIDLVITTYGALLRSPALVDMQWRLAVLDEAQAIKNPAAKQTRQVKKLNAHSRIALTGTPVENSLSDLWSIFDFTHPGLLGTQKIFADFSKRLARSEHFAPLRALVRPYILRRLKTDKRVIADLPDKTELKAWCHLHPAQAALYQDAVEELAEALEDAEGIARKGVVLSYLMRLKQICNHPSQWLGDGAWNGRRQRQVRPAARAGRDHCRQAGKGACIHPVS